MYKIHVTEVFIHLHGIIYKIQVTARGLHSSTRHYLQDTEVVFIYGARRITGLVIGGVTIPELTIGKEKLNLISIILRKTETYNHIRHLIKLGISKEKFGYLVKKKQCVQRRKKKKNSTLV